MAGVADNTLLDNVGMTRSCSLSCLSSAAGGDREGESTSYRLEISSSSLSRPWLEVGEMRVTSLVMLDTEYKGEVPGLARVEGLPLYLEILRSGLLDRAMMLLLSGRVSSGDPPGGGGSCGHLEVDQCRGRDLS